MNARNILEWTIMRSEFGRPGEDISSLPSLPIFLSSNFGGGSWLRRLIFVIVGTMKGFRKHSYLTTKK
jgi:hypothetical protein